MAGKARSKLLSDRLLRALTEELAQLEAGRPTRRRGTDGDENTPLRSADGKARIEAIGQLTRSLEKLLELREIEALGRSAAAEGDDVETERLRAEMLKRLRALDARRAERGGLFAPGPEAAS
ncbi:hypothetical protein [Aureimonas sp. AU40]|uniref:hypothetical protein n=1 Tax=Aureimonas sp. AU40 TaxID=1637747 RepID=UPI000785355B|nr:hypothetical protein [Aureimonas sp. AU40]